MTGTSQQRGDGTAIRLEGRSMPESETVPDAWGTRWNARLLRFRGVRFALAAAIPSI